MVNYRFVYIILVTPELMNTSDEDEERPVIPRKKRSPMKNVGAQLNFQSSPIKFCGDSSLELESNSNSKTTKKYKRCVPKWVFPSVHFPRRNPLPARPAHSCWTTMMDDMPQPPREFIDELKVRQKNPWKTRVRHRKGNPVMVPKKRQPTSQSKTKKTTKKTGTSVHPPPACGACTMIPPPRQIRDDHRRHTGVKYMHIPAYLNNEDFRALVRVSNCPSFVRFDDAPIAPQ